MKFAGSRPSACWLSNPLSMHSMERQRTVVGPLGRGQASQLRWRLAGRAQSTAATPDNTRPEPDLAAEARVQRRATLLARGSPARGNRASSSAARAWRFSDRAVEHDPEHVVVL